MNGSAENGSDGKKIELNIENKHYLKIFTIIRKYGGSARLVGGIVRDALLGRACKDVDIATDLLPDRIEEIFLKEGFKVVPTGKAFGTISVFVYIPQTDSFESFEITTLRKDLRCDGRKAYVEYCKDYFEDAKRRDFTINALSYDPTQNKLYDYFDGESDLKSKRVKFIGEAPERIKEDYLRILRYFRFLARFSEFTKQGSSQEDVYNIQNGICIKLDSSKGLYKALEEDKRFVGVEVDQESLSACRIHAEGISGLSRERIKSEMDLILETENSPYILQIMKEQDIWQYIFNHSNRDIKPGDIVVLRKIAKEFRGKYSGFNIEPSLYYAVILSSSGFTFKQLMDLKFSSKESKLIEELLQSREEFLENQLLAGFEQDEGEIICYLKSFLIRRWLEDSNYQLFFMFTCLCLCERQNSSINQAFELISTIYEELQDKLDADGRRPIFPVHSRVLMDMGFAGPELGDILRELKDMWIDSGFTLTKEILLKEARGKLQ